MSLVSHWLGKDETYWLPTHALEPLEKATKYLCISASWVSDDSSHRSGEKDLGAGNTPGSMSIQYMVMLTGVCAADSEY
ncbi:hypothetical protein N7447_000106 [Penicillium robsamsonii]|uniref:uncharacterized protein n=1 Tax=Penicillium robsamsonii TaxID=1792511 RepID=UPI00254822CB|nr:uncharacterized protein N7447_000106 [Penicillium robsamsonii]KAJ5834080.1 hypothetical protein N7447_000106 [Penicillium robsamsonii]